MKIPLKCKLDAMYAHLNENPTQNFIKHSSILKNPKNFQKIPKPRFQNMKCMKNERFEAY